MCNTRYVFLKSLWFMKVKNHLFLLRWRFSYSIRITWSACNLGRRKNTQVVSWMWMKILFSFYSVLLFVLWWVSSNSNAVFLLWAPRGATATRKDHLKTTFRSVKTLVLEESIASKPVSRHLILLLLEVTPFRCGTMPRESSLFPKNSLVFHYQYHSTHQGCTC